MKNPFKNFTPRQWLIFLLIVGVLIYYFLIDPTGTQKPGTVVTAPIPNPGRTTGGTTTGGTTTGGTNTYTPNQGDAITIPFFNHPDFLQIQVTRQGNDYILNDTSTYTAPGGYEFIYYLDLEEIRGGKLTNYLYQSNRPLLVHKQVIKQGFGNLYAWGNDGWQDATGGSFIDGAGNLGGQVEIYFN